MKSIKYIYIYINTKEQTFVATSITEMCMTSHMILHMFGTNPQKYTIFWGQPLTFSVERKDLSVLP